MSWFDKLLGRDTSTPTPAPVPMREAAGAQSAGEDPDEEGWTRLSGDYSSNRRDLTPLSQDRMQRLAEWLWQSNLLGNRLVELMLAYLLAEGVTLQCKDDAHQKLLDAFWRDPINNFPLKLEARARALSLMGEQCYRVSVNEASGFVRLGYIDPQHIGTVVLDPDNPEQPIGVVTKKDAKGRYHKYRVIVLGDDEALFTARTAEIRATDFPDGDCFLYQVNKLATGSRGRSDLLSQMDWLDAYDEFLFGEFDRARYLRAFVWDLNVKNGDEDAIKKRAKNFKAPDANSVFVHNDGEELSAKTPELQATDSSQFARMFRNHVLGGATVPEHWFGGGGDVNRAAASEMGEPTFKIYTARQKQLKLMLEEMGRYVLWKSSTTKEPDWADEAWQVTAVFPELVNQDLTKFAAALRDVATTVISLIGQGLITEERGLGMVADIAQRFGQEIDAKAELEAARAEKTKRDADRAKQDAFNLPADMRAAMKNGQAQPADPAQAQTQGAQP
jgi:hypothetical protein